MSGDKRSVSTDALETLGTIIPEGSGRDAIHLAVEPVVAGELLDPGDGIALENGLAVSASEANTLGIVDPFLRKPVKKGERFWLVVLPRQITSLRHVWTHPGFPEASTQAMSASAPPDNSKQLSETWLRNFCRHNDCPSYDRLMQALANGSEGSDDDDYGIEIDGDYIQVNGSDAHCDIPNEFWDHAEIVLGRKFTQRPTYFSCGC